MVKKLGREGADKRTTGKNICGGGPSGALVWIGDVGGEPPAGEGPHGLPPLGGPSHGGHGPQIPIERDMGISTHWGGAGNGGTRIDQSVYRLL